MVNPLLLMHQGMHRKYLVSVFSQYAKDLCLMQPAALLVNTVNSERQGIRDQKRGQQSDMKWKREERESLKAYLGNV